MNTFTKEQMISLLLTVKEAAAFITSKDLGLDVSEQVLKECKEALAVLDEAFDEPMDIVQCRIKSRILLAAHTVSGVLEDLKHTGSIPVFSKDFHEGFDVLVDEIRSDIVCKLEILFLPYKYSMWDSMESIWEAARKDPMCNCRLVPIPYYDRDENMNFKTLHYEGDSYPMEIEDYRTYQMEEIRPDIIYFHNPYDEYNRITSVEPRFYVSELVKYTDMLVYVPYYMFGEVKSHYEICADKRVNRSTLATKIILPCENVRQCYIISGEKPEKLAVLGSPKIDAAVNMKKDREIPDKWKSKLDNRKIILFNTSLTTYLSNSSWLSQMKDIIISLANRKEIALVWRPHPLFEATVDSMRITDKIIYDEMLAIIEASDNAVRDYNEDLMTAIGISDALISDYSSVLLQYTFTGKPALSMTNTSKERKSIVFCDFFSHYFMNDGVTVDEFVEMIIRGEDEKKVERMRYARESVVNADGTCGEKVHEFVKGEVMRKQGD